MVRSEYNIGEFLYGIPDKEAENTILKAKECSSTMVMLMVTDMVF